ncbi:MAG: hypothetical protein ACRDTG_31870 [Pseudonocardiaceae bacterium]
MADYTQPDVVNKRVRFFDGQFLQDQDFIDEQKYHLDRQRRQSQLFGVTGVVSGLTVLKGGAYQVTVTKGVAVDALGRQLVLATETDLRLSGQFAKKQGIELRLVYQETPTDLAQTGGEGARRWDESPKIVALAPDGAVAVAPDGASSTWDGPTVLLAHLAVADNGEVTVDATVASKAGLSVPGALGVGTTAPPWKLSVSSSKEHLALYRESTETAGGSHVFLELAQIDTGTPRVPEVFPSIRFHHHHRFWHRIEGQASGLHFKTGDPTRNDYSDIMVRNITATGKLDLTDITARNITASGKLEVTGQGGLNIDLVVNGRLRSNNNDGGLWVAEDRFVGGHTANQIGFFNKGWRFTVLPGGQVGIGTSDPENAENWNKVVDFLGAGNAKLSVRTAKVDSRVMVHDSGHFGSPAGMIVGTKTDHALSFATNATTRLSINAAGNVGIGTTGPPWKLSVSSSKEHLALYREGTETTGGTHIFLELAQIDAGSPRVPAVFPSIRFHHHNRFWHRIEAQGGPAPAVSGFHFKDGHPDNNGYSDIYANTVTSKALRIGNTSIGEAELSALKTLAAGNLLGILQKLAAGTLEFDLYNVKQDEYAYAADYAPYDDDRRRIFTWRPKGRINQGRWRIHYPS